MIYDNLIETLKSNHFYPGKIVSAKKKGDVVDGLFINCPSILSESRLEKVRDILPDGFKADYLSNKQEIHITKK